MDTSGRYRSSAHGLRRFNLNQIAFHPLAKDGPIAVASGERGSGKSSIVEMLLYMFRDIPCVYLFSATETNSDNLGRRIPPSNLCDKFDENAMQGIIEMQKRKHRELVRRNVLDDADKLRDRIAKGGADGEAAKHELDRLTASVEDPRIMVIFDDMMGDSKEWANSDGVKKFFVNGRHLHIMFVLTLQYQKGIAPVMRNNIDFIFKFPTAPKGDTVETWKKFLDSYQCSTYSPEELSVIEAEVKKYHKYAVVTFGKQNTASTSALAGGARNGNGRGHNDGRTVNDTVSDLVLNSRATNMRKVDSSEITIGEEFDNVFYYLGEKPTGMIHCHVRNTMVPAMNFVTSNKLYWCISICPALYKIFRSELQTDPIISRSGRGTNDKSNEISMIVLEDGLEKIRKEYETVKKVMKLPQAGLDTDAIIHFISNGGDPSLYADCNKMAAERNALVMRRRQLMQQQQAQQKAQQAQQQVNLMQNQQLSQPTRSSQIPQVQVQVKIQQPQSTQMTSVSTPLTNLDRQRAAIQLSQQQQQLQAPPALSRGNSIFSLFSQS